MQLPHAIVNQIAGLTSLRDVELLEFSMLKSIEHIFKPVAVNLLKLDNDGNPLREIDYQGERFNIQDEEIEINQEIAAAMKSMNLSAANEYSTRLGDKFATIYLLHNNHRTSTFLTIITKEKITKAENDLFSAMLQIYRNFSELLVYSQTDELTGLENRKTFDTYIKKLYEIKSPEHDDFPNNQRINSTGNKPNSYWLVLIDIDHFKRVNDNFGHLYGDEVLVLLAQIMRRSFREYDLLFRFGGEEFVVILQSPDRESCFTALERLRREVNSFNFPGVGNVTISAGAVKMSPDIFHMILLEYADQALYYSKKNGRNQIAFFEDLVSAGKAVVKNIDSGEIELF